MYRERERERHTDLHTYIPEDLKKAKKGGSKLAAAKADVWYIMCIYIYIYIYIYRERERVS